ncbi:MAG: hypothetical protein DBX55_01190 [Verrucomicrobia bacterium]|nr:MAG: hypothetical protein DBX55_01190 [Verrucomicrobiota bacterium]
MHFAFAAGAKAFLHGTFCGKFVRKNWFGKLVRPRVRVSGADSIWGAVALTFGFIFKFFARGLKARRIFKRDAARLAAWIPSANRLRCCGGVSNASEWGYFFLCDAARILREAEAAGGYGRAGRGVFRGSAHGAAI